MPYVPFCRIRPTDDLLGQDYAALVPRTAPLRLHPGARTRVLNGRDEQARRPGLVASAIRRLRSSFSKETAMSATEVHSPSSNADVGKVKMNLEIQVIPVSDVDRAKKFYERLAWRLDDDVAPL